LDNSSRRSVVSLLLSGAIGGLSVGCNPPAAARKKVGLLEHGTKQSYRYSRELVGQLRRFGWIEGVNLEIEHHVDGDELARIPAIIDGLESQRVAVLVIDYNMLSAVRKARTAMPIVCYQIFDAVGQGVTTTLAAPSGNITGISWQSDETVAKRLEMAVELVPGLKRVALIAADDAPGAMEANALRKATAGIGVSLVVYTLSTESGERTALFAEMVRSRPELLFIAASDVTYTYIDEIVKVALIQRLPTISEESDFAKRGVLATYGPNLLEMFRLAVGQVDKILKGAKVQEVPFQQPTEFELAANKRTAREIGIELPQLLILRATRVFD